MNIKPETNFAITSSPSDFILDIFFLHVIYIRLYVFSVNAYTVNQSDFHRDKFL